jgi:hypothetical protein
VSASKLSVDEIPLCRGMLDFIAKGHAIGRRIDDDTAVDQDLVVNRLAGTKLLFPISHPTVFLAVLLQRDAGRYKVVSARLVC